MQLENPEVKSVPETREAALERREALIAEVQALQATMPKKSDRTRRREVNALLQEKLAEIRRLKAWLRTNDEGRFSEWALLGRAHRLLLALLERAEAQGLGESVESLLDDIERIVPGRYMDGA